MLGVVGVVAIAIRGAGPGACLCGAAGEGAEGAVTAGEGRRGSTAPWWGLPGAGAGPPQVFPLSVSFPRGDPVSAALPRRREEPKAAVTPQAPAAGPGWKYPGQLGEMTGGGPRPFPGEVPVVSPSRRRGGSPGHPPPRGGVRPRWPAREGGPERGRFVPAGAPCQVPAAEAGGVAKPMGLSPHSAPASPGAAAPHPPLQCFPQPQ